MAARVAASAAHQAISDRRDRLGFPPPGQLIDIGGWRLHLLVAGEKGPAAIIVPALGDSVLLWIRIQRALAADMRVAAYARAGIGWSDPPPSGRHTLDDSAADLHRLLDAAGFPRPCPTVAHSLGGSSPGGSQPSTPTRSRDCS